MYGSKDIPAVGKLDFEWINTPFAAVVKAHKIDDDDTGMVGASANGDNSVDKGPGADVDYDVAEEDDRWMVE